MKIDVIWADYRADSNGRGFWDQGLLELYFSGELWQPEAQFEFVHHYGFGELLEGETAGAVVVFKAGNNAEHETVERLNDDMASLAWVLLISTGDEESRLDHLQIRHANIHHAIALPRPHKHAHSRPNTTYFGCGMPADTSKLLGEMNHDRTLDFVFSGQVNHVRREQCVDAVRHLPNGSILRTPGFTQGLDRRDYLQQLANAKVVLCPSGPETPDTFRVWEALEAGSMPLADTQTPENKVPDYWPFLTGGEPFLLVDDWNDAPALIRSVVQHWPASVNRTLAWWQKWKRQFVVTLNDAISELSGLALRKSITFMITSSPCHKHPRTEMIAETIESIRAQVPGAEILVLQDGVREDQEFRRGDYEKYLNKLLWQCAHQWQGVLPIIFDQHEHQARMVRQALNMVRTPFIVFCEHDTPLVGEIDWQGIQHCISEGTADIVRLYQNTDLEPAHAHLFHGTETHAGVTLTRTSQFSARPHVASTAFYRNMLERYFDPAEVMFIEERMHGVCAQMWNANGALGWYQCRIWIYNPGGNIQRSLHTDGRGTDEPYPTRHDEEEAAGRTNAEVDAS